jgi:hypothetical protein
MGVYAVLTKYDELLRDISSPPIIVNDLKSVTEEDRAKISNLTRSNYVDDIFTNVPTCGCGHLRGRSRKDKICHLCGTAVKSPTESGLEPRAWIRSPNGTAKIINPVIWNMLRLRFKKSGFNFIDWICRIDPRGKATKPEADLDRLVSLGIQRGYNYLSDNLIRYVEILEGLDHFKKTTYEHGLLELLRVSDPDRIRSFHLPLPNKTLMVFEENVTGRYLDPMLSNVFDCIAMMQGIDTNMDTLTDSQKERRVAKMLNMIAPYYYDMYHEVLAKKSGMMRKNAYGGRNNFATRAVISSNTKPHEYDTIEISWGQAIAVFDQHLRNILTAKGWTPAQCTRWLYRRIHKYCPDLDGMFKDLIAGTPGGRGFWAIYIRNPSLARGSTQAVRISKVKTDPSDPTTSGSILAVVAPNADFDGDAMTVILMLDNKMSEAIQALAPHKNMLDPDRPLELTNVAAVPKTQASNLSNWMRGTDRNSIQTPDQKSYLEQLALN